ncbi:MAG: hypothetical protein MUF49_23525 [Oculatellaceae cyanobacterium Prado106]|jgi:hypothetical protein|nr:hypothetical protein [Oculatellaceae cyanobacterium Prado106]
MPRTQILDPDESYEFSKYAELPFTTGDILAEFNVGFKNQSLQFPQHLPISTDPLRIELEENLTLVDPVSEIARREALIFPILKTICKFTQAPLKIEYPVRVNNWLKGSFDYFLPIHKNLIVIEAKNADLARGFAENDTIENMNKCIAARGLCKYLFQNLSFSRFAYSKIALKQSY